MSQLIEVFGYKVPESTIPIWSLSESDKNEMINRHDVTKGNPATYFHITNRPDSDTIEGYLGHSDMAQRDGLLKFHTVILGGPSYWDDYIGRKPVHFTFDKVTIYKIIYVLPTTGGPLLICLKRITIRKQTKIGQAFMIMPFMYDDLNKIYFEHVKGMLENELSITIKRADDYTDNDVIIDTILHEIEYSEFVIADSTYCSRNAFYEIGYADAIGKDVIVMQDESKEEPIFFDKRHTRAIMYKIDDMESSVGSFSKQ